MTSTDRRWSTSSNRSETAKFPDFDPSVNNREHFTIYEDGDSGHVPERYPSGDLGWSRQNGSLHSDRWTLRKEHSHNWGNGYARGHGRQKSLSDAIRTIRTRKGSVSANAQEIAEALKAPVSFKLIVRMVLRMVLDFVAAHT